MSGKLRHDRACLRPKPRLGRRACALKGNPPGGKSDALRDGCGARPQLVGVGIAGREDALGQAVGREQDLDRARSREPLERLGDPRGNGVEELGVVTPAPHQHGLEPPGGGLEQLLLVGANGHRRVVRREHDPHDPPMSIRHDLLDHFADVGMPMPHPHVDYEPLIQRPLHTGGLRLGEPPYGRAAADSRVPLSDLLHELGGSRSPTPHVLQVRLDLVEACRAAVRHQQHGDSLSRHAPTPPPPAGPLPASRGERRAPD